jgi:hypothetical protein
MATDEEIADRISLDLLSDTELDAEIERRVKALNVALFARDKRVRKDAHIYVRNRQYVSHRGAVSYLSPLEP